MKMGRNPKTSALRLDWNDCHVMCSRRDSNPLEYPTSLLDPRICCQELLHNIYSRLPARLSMTKQERNAAIYRRYKQGETTAELAKSFGLCIQRIRGIIRQMKS